MLSNYPDKLVIHEPTAESGIYVTVFNEGKEGQSAQNTPLNKGGQGGSFITDYSQLPASIGTEADLETALTLIVYSLTAKSNETEIPISNVASQFNKQYGEDTKKTMNRLQLSGKLSKLLQSYSNFQLTKIKGLYHVALVTKGKSAQIPPLESQVDNYSQLPNPIETEADLETALTIIMSSLTAESNKTGISLANIGQEFLKQYGISINKTMARLQLSGNFLKLLQSYSNFQLTKIKGGYHVALVTSS